MGETVQVRKLVWGSLLTAFGILILTGTLFGQAKLGMRLGLGATLITLGALVLMIPLTTWIIEKTTKPADYKGTCPVGRVCPKCGTFNFFPRTECRSCEHDLGEVPLATHS